MNHNSIVMSEKLYDKLSAEMLGEIEAKRQKKEGLEKGSVFMFGHLTIVFAEIEGFVFGNINGLRVEKGVEIEKE